MAPSFIDNVDFRPQAIGQQLTNVLKQAIVNNEIAGGVRLVERDLQKKFGVSRSPIREAIRDLEQMGLVEIAPRKGTIVKVVTKKDICEDYLVRAPLEGLAAKHAFSNMGKEEIATLQRTLQGMRKATKNRDHDGFWQAHSRFHDTFINACGIGLLSALLRVLRLHSFRHRMVFPFYQEDLKPHLANHEKILDMFCDSKTDPDDLEQFVVLHINVARDKFLDNIPENKEE